MLFEKIAILNKDCEIERDMYVLTKGSTITYVGKERPEGEQRRVVDGKNKLLMPAFYNAHGHTPMTILRGYGENMELSRWLNEKIFPFEAKLTPAMVYNSTLVGIAEMFASGVVSSTDMYFHGEAILSAFEKSGAKLNLSIGTTCFDDRSFYELPDYAENERLFSYWHGKDGGRLRVDMSIHGEYTSSPKVVEGVAEYAKDKHCRMQLHLSETKKEHEECIARHGKTPAKYFADLGLFDVPATAAHCVWLSEEDMDILAEKGVTAATCPVSNMKLASGIADIPGMEKHGVRIALGTDGASSNNSLGMLDEMKSLALVQRVGSGNPAAVSPEQVLTYATRNAAASQGRNDAGVIAEGYRADLVVLDIDKPHFYPQGQLVNHVVYAANNGDILMTICDGNIVYDHGRFPTIDIEKALSAMERDFRTVVSQL
ncbi:MAG: amidohydrolase [Firmicutes bacterium]|nr:amidohydrolase [Bacillota bacterium]